MRVYTRLRRAERHEQERLAGFCAHAYGGPADYFLRRWRNDPSPGSFGLVLEEGAEVAGYLHVFERQLWLDGRTVKCAGIGNVAVDPARRGRGHSIRLMEDSLAECTQAGFEFSLLYTHIPELYARVGFRSLPWHEVEGPANTGRGWYSVPTTAAEDQALYEVEYRGRQGTVLRDERYWASRENWLRPEGWTLLKHPEEDGYCWVQAGPEGGLIDEAVAGCARRLDRESPMPGTWRRRLPNSRGSLGISPAEGAIMARDLSGRLDINALAWADAVFWSTDSF